MDEPWKSTVFVLQPMFIKCSSIDSARSTRAKPGYSASNIYYIIIYNNKIVWHTQYYITLFMWAFNMSPKDEKKKSTLVQSLLHRAPILGIGEFFKELLLCVGI